MVESGIKNVSSAVGSEEPNDKLHGRRQREEITDESSKERVAKTRRIEEGGRALFVKPVVVEADHNDTEQEHPFSAINSGSEYNEATSESNIDSALLATEVHRNNTDDIIRDIPEVAAKEMDSGSMVGSSTVVEAAAAAAAAAVVEAEMNYKEFLKRVESARDDHTLVTDMGCTAACLG